MDKETLSNINKYLLLLILGFLFLIVFLIDYFGYGWPNTIFLLIWLGAFSGLYHTGKTVQNDFFRRGANLIINISLAGVTGFIIFMLSKISQNSIDWLYTFIFILIPFVGFLAWSIYNTYEYWAIES